MAAHRAVGNVPVGNGNDGVVIVLRQVVEDHLAGWAELICDAVTEQLDIFQSKVQVSSLPCWLMSRTFYHIEIVLSISA